MMKAEEFAAIQVEVPKVSAKEARAAMAQARREEKAAAKESREKRALVQSYRNRIAFQTEVAAKATARIEMLTRQLLEIESGAVKS